MKKVGCLVRIGCMLLLCNLTVDSVVGEILPITDRINGCKYYLFPVRIVSSGNDLVPTENEVVCFFRNKQASKWMDSRDRTYSWGDYHIQRTYSNQQALD